MPSFIPVPWRKYTPLHQKLGARSHRYTYPAGAASVPILGVNPFNMIHVYSAVHGIDRIIGMLLSVAPTATAFTFQITENITGWQFGYAYPGLSKWLYTQVNLETMPDQANLTWSFSATPGANAYISFFNFEIIPFELS